MTSERGKRLQHERRELRRMRRTALRMREQGYKLCAIAKKMGRTEDDVWELLKEEPC